MPTLLVSDANVVIDLDDGGILEPFFELDADIIIPDVLVRDELDDYAERLTSLGLQPRPLTGESLRRVLELDGEYPNPSRYDLMALTLAEQESCILLTGDSHLRKAADSEDVDVHGTIWVCDRLVEHGIVPPSDIADAYAAMKRSTTRLPWDIVRERLDALDCDIPEVLEP